MKILIGNTYPPALVRRRVVVTPISVDEARDHLANGFESFWGHTNTAGLGTEILGVDVLPETERPAVTLGDEGFPVLNGVTARKVLVLSPDYVPGYRPAIGEEVPADKITGWQCLLWDFS